jgi:uncharacterized protein (TIGR02452 family)
LADLKPDQYPDTAEGWEQLTNAREVEHAYQHYKRDTQLTKFSYTENGKKYYIEFHKAYKDDGTSNPRINKVPSLLATRCFLSDNNNIGYRSIRRRYIPDPNAVRQATSPSGYAATAPPGGGRGCPSWDSAGWLARSRNTGERDHRSEEQRALMKEVADHNKLLIDYRLVHIPDTRYSDYRREYRDQNFVRQHAGKREAVVSFSTWSTTQAALHFASKRKAISVLNFANGEKIGGGYARGARAQEEDLCRAFPGLYGSLGKARDRRYYPFGPAAYARHPTRYADLLFTDDLECLRADNDEGWRMLGSRDRFKVSIVSAAAPNLPKGEPAIHEELLNLHAHILLAPKLLQPRTDLLILGAFGCGVFQNDPKVIAMYFSNFLKRQSDYLRLYEEIHFAIPPGTNFDGFAEVFQDARIPVQVYQ